MYGSTLAINCKFKILQYTLSFFYIVEYDIIWYHTTLKIKIERYIERMSCLRFYFYDTFARQCPVFPTTWSSSAMVFFSALRAGVVLSFFVTIARCFTPTREASVKSRSTFGSTSSSRMSSNIFDVDRRTAASLVGSAWGFVFSNVANASGDSETKNIPPRCDIICLWFV